MEPKTTDDLRQELMNDSDLDTYLGENQAYFTEQNIAALLNDVYQGRDISKAALARKAGMSEVYLHQVFSGRRKPSRDRLLCLCIGLEATLEETNDALKEAEAGFNLEPGRNEIPPDEMALTTVGDTPEEANGFGLLDTGTGSMEKVHVTNGKLDEAINQVNHDGTTNMLAFVIIGPNRYEVKGDTLTDC